MSVILLILGIVVAAAGFAAIGFGVPGNELTLGTTLIIAGTTALTGGLVLIGLSAVVKELGRLADALRTRAAAARPAARPAETVEHALPAGPPVIAAAAPAFSGRPPQANVPAPPRPRPAETPVREARPSEPAPAGPSAVEVSAAAIERLRSSIPRTEQRPRAEAPAASDPEDVPLSPNGATTHPAPPAGDTPLPEPKVTAEDRADEGTVEALRASRLDFLFRARPAARPGPQSENFDAFWPADARPGRSAEPQSRADDEVQRQPDYAPAAQDRPAPDRRAEPASAGFPAILKSGVVDGMAYTLYADGSIEAKLPHGTVRFGSIAELRAHIESNS
jgi:hypothetical protein